MVDLAAAITDRPDDVVFFANDVAVADDGTAYVTDTRMNVIYRVDTDYQASVLHQFDDGDGGPNGIVHHPGGYLLVARGAALWNVPLDDPASATEVMLPTDIPGQDGMVWTAGRLAIVSNDGRVVALTSDDDWATAELAGVATYEGQATTVAVVGDDLYVVHPHFGDADPPSVSRVVLQ
jgi:sugar lactone lactonase YvrE